MHCITNKLILHFMQKSKYAAYQVADEFLALNIRSRAGASLTLRAVYSSSSTGSGPWIQLEPHQSCVSYKLSEYQLPHSSNMIDTSEDPGLFILKEHRTDHCQEEYVRFCHMIVHQSWGSWLWIHIKSLGPVLVNICR